MPNLPTVVINLDNPLDISSTNAPKSDQKHTIIHDPGTGYKPESVKDERKIVGFLVSYSKKETGEYWPIFLGRNIIGKSVDADISLREASVSEEHAILNTRRVSNLNNEEELIYVISDNNSTVGVRVEGRDIVYDNNNRLLKPNEFIDIGHYKLMLICVDNKVLNLTVNPEFRSLDQEEIDGAEINYDQRPNPTRVYQNG